MLFKRSLSEEKKNPKVATGINGLDDILRGGFPKNRFLLIEGMPGSGKTTLALQFLIEGARRGERVLYITLSETMSELEEVAESHNWDLRDIEIFELSALEKQLSVESQNTLFQPAEVELTKTTQIILREIDKIAPARVVIDSLSELRLLAQSSLRFRRQLLAIKQFFAQRHCTVLFLDDLTADNIDLQVQSLAHGVVSLEQLSPEYGSERRRLTIRKLRGVPFRGGYHDFSIKTGGLQVFPRLVAAEHRELTKSLPVSSGIPEMDELFGGGVDQATSTLIMGPSGAGKSTLALQYAIKAADLGNKSAIFTFDENITTLFARAHNLSMNFLPHVESGMISINQIDPAELSPGEFIYKIRHCVENSDVKMVIIDSLNGYINAMPHEKHLIIQLHELLAYLCQKNVLTFLVYAQHGMIGTMNSPIDLTYLSDNVVLIRNFEFQGSVRKAISVVKKRTGQHEKTIRELEIDGGIKIGKPLVNFHGVLTGVPKFKGTLDTNE